MAEDAKAEDSGTLVPEILLFFSTDHYQDEDLKPIANGFRDLAYAMFQTYGWNEQIHFSLQHMLVAKDAAVRGVKRVLDTAKEPTGLAVPEGQGELWTPDESQ